MNNDDTVPIGWRTNDGVIPRSSTIAMLEAKDAVIASLRAELAGAQHAVEIALNERVNQRASMNAEIASLRAELASRQIDVKTFNEANRQLRAELAQWTNTANLAGGVVHSLRAELTAQKAEPKYAEALRAELADESPGTPLGRLSAIAAAAKERGLCTGVEAKPAEVFLIEALDTLRAEVAAEREKAHYANGVANLAIKHRDVAEAAARQDVEEKARLTGLLERWMRHADIGDLWRDAAGHVLGDTMVAQDTRAALACTPTVMPSGVQQTKEIARLRSVMQWIETKALLAYQGKADKTEIVSAINNYARAALACTPTEVPTGVQQSEEKARLRDALKIAERFIASQVNDLSPTLRFVRAALACRPQGEKS